MRAKGEHRGGEIYYTMPIFIRGIPCYLGIVRAEDVAREFWQALAQIQRERDKLAKLLEPRFSDERLAAEFETWATLPGCSIDSVEDLLASIPRHPWTSWLDSAPGSVVYADGSKVSLAFDQLLTGICKRMKGDEMSDDQGKNSKYQFGHVERLFISERDTVYNENQLGIPPGEFMKMLAEFKAVVGANHPDVMNALQTAEREEESGNRKAAINALRRVGKKLMQFAEKIGTKVAIEYMERILLNAPE